MDLSWAASVEKMNSDHTVQGSEAWKVWRGKGLGSSDAAVLLGWSPWKTITQLLDEKHGLWKPVFGAHQRAAMDRGTQLEPEIRRWYELMRGIGFPVAIAEDSSSSHYRASFDGINREFVNPEDQSVGRIIEIKAPNMKDHALAKERLVPEKYQPQVQWLMMVGNVPWCDYVSFGHDGEHHVVEVKADPIMQAELRKRADLFWQHVQTKAPIYEWPKWDRGGQIQLDLSGLSAPAATEKAFVEEAKREEPQQIADQEIEAIVAEALQLKDESDAASARYEAKKEVLKKILGTSEEMQKGEGVFGWQKRKGNVDYSIIPELIGLDLDQFRKQPIKAFYLKRSGEK